MNDLNIAQGNSLFEQRIVSPQWYVLLYDYMNSKQKNSILCNKYFWY